MHTTELDCLVGSTPQLDSTVCMTPQSQTISILTRQQDAHWGVSYKFKYHGKIEEFKNILV